MKERKVINLKSMLSLIALILTLLFTQIPAQAGCTGTGPTPDTDCDGITDAEENIPVCSKSECQLTTASCDLNTKDFFVILWKCDDPNHPYASSCPNHTTNLPSNLDPLGILSPGLSTVASSDLHIKVHQIDQSETCCAANSTNNSTCVSDVRCNDFTSCARNVTPNQMAVRIIEKTDTNGADLGVTTPPGIPIAVGDAVVFTQRIKNFVHGLCNCPANDATNCSSTCVDADNVTKGENNVIAKFIRHTIAHEAGHAMTLRAVSSTDIGEHYPTPTSAKSAASATLLDYAVYYTKSSKGVTTFYIGSHYYTGTAYSPNDTAGATLR